MLQINDHEKVNNNDMNYIANIVKNVKMVQLLYRETSCFEPPLSVFIDLGSIPG